LGKPRLENATIEHAEIIGSIGLRTADMQELYRSTGNPSAKENLLNSLRASYTAKTAFVDNEPVAMFGVALTDVFTLEGCIWLLATEKAADYWLSFGKISREFIDKAKDSHSRLFNYVDAENTISINWLKWLGFNIHEPQPYGFSRTPFHYFEWRSDICVQ